MHPNSGGVFFFVRNADHGSVFVEHYEQFVDVVEASEIAEALFGVPFTVRPQIVNSRRVFGGPVWAADREQVPILSACLYG